MTDEWWRVAGAPTPDEWSAFWAGATAIIAASAAAIALVQLRSYLLELRERARPYVIADFGFRSTILFVHIWNSSSTPARDLTIRVDPAFESNRREDAEKLRRVTSDDFLVPQLAPGRELRWVLDATPAYYGNKDLPRSYTVTLEYADGRKGNKVRYQDNFVLNIDQWSEALADNDYPNKNWNIAKRVESDLGDIKRSIAKIASELESVSKPQPKRTSSKKS